MGHIFTGQPLFHSLLKTTRYGYRQSDLCKCGLFQPPPQSFVTSHWNFCQARQWTTERDKTLSGKYALYKFFLDYPLGPIISEKVGDFFTILLSLSMGDIGKSTGWTFEDLRLRVRVVTNP